MITYMNRHYCLITSEGVRVHPGIKLVGVFSQGAKERYESAEKAYDWFLHDFQNRDMILHAKIVRTGADPLEDGSPILLRVSELDVGIDANDEKNWERQAFFYGELFKMYAKYADQLIAVHTWGTVDDLSWRADEYPLLFDNKAQPKPAFDAIVD